MQKKKSIVVTPASSSLSKTYIVIPASFPPHFQDPPGKQKNLSSEDMSLALLMFTLSVGILMKVCKSALPDFICFRQPVFQLPIPILCQTIT